MGKKITGIQIDGVGPNLKTRGTSNVWIHGNNLKKNDVVTIRSSNTVWWEGTIAKANRATDCGLAQVTYKGTRKRRAGDLLNVTITITRSDDIFSNLYRDNVIQDGPA